MKRISTIVVASLLIASPSLAQEAENAAPEESAPQQVVAPQPPVPPTKEQIKAQKAQMEAQLVDIKRAMDEDPQNLDNFFNYAKLASVLGKGEEAEGAYLHMLSVNPELHRVKLELGLLYTGMGRLKEAKALFEEVLKTNPPEQVQKNINTILTTVDKGLKPDIISISAAMGINRDSNANSAASTGETTYNDISLPLQANSTADEDVQTFATTSITHMHKFDVDSNDYGVNLISSGTLYRTYQDTEHGLEISLGSARTGPTLDLKKLKTQFGVAGTKSVISLDSHVYLKTTAGDFTIKYAPLNNLIFDYGYTYEYRKFANSPTVNTNVDRTGNAYQHKIGATYAFTPLDLFNASIIWRDEAARNDAFGNDQAGFTGSYTRQLPYDFSVNIMGNIKMTHYSDLDTTISSDLLRNDRERSTTLTLAKKLPRNITATVGYQYKNVTSNIQNYDYVNHRFSGAVGWAF